ncbi:hypothetical protein GCM10025855_25620 [Shewanella glacialipiscicola]|uniref:Uncharacterized protein n=1 Tax=Shewanella glacialipiscicola TaxID=614069 RepID=A0ABQ6J712_9GAMM|nr:hypothetical protein GCM10025855_25620 [Shewanella glacialipiscicola]
MLAAPINNILGYKLDNKKEIVINGDIFKGCAKHHYENNYGCFAIINHISDNIS